jgi:hypothetical protein
MARAASVEEEAWLYGAPGWTHEAGVEEVVAPFLEGRSARFRDFARFSALGEQAARDLLVRLPEENLGDRQNLGPRCREALRAAVAHPGEVLLFGYLVSPPRWDERLTIDGMLVAGGAAPPARAASAGPIRIWRDVRGRLGLGADTGEPDELMRMPLPGDADGRIGWWMWWD